MYLALVTGVITWALTVRMGAFHLPNCTKDRLRIKGREMV